MSDITDDFLNGSQDKDKEFLSPQTNNSSSSKTEEILKETEISTFTNSIPQLPPDDYPANYVNVVNRVVAYYKILPHLNYDKIYQEISELTVKTAPTPTLEIINDELFKVQRAKERIAEILIDVVKCYNYKKRAVDILKDAWGKFSSEKNAEGRKGDATYRLNDFLNDFAATEACYKACEHVFRNLDSLQDNLAKRISTWQLILKLREGRMGTPDFEFDKETDSKADLFNSNSNDIEDSEKDSDKDSDNNGKIKLREF